MKIFTYLSIFSLLFIFSCRSSDALIPVNEVDNVIVNELGIIPTNKKAHLIQSGDELTVKILSEDPNLGKYLGTEFVDNGNGSSTPSRTVDSDGYISIPYLGKIYVLNKTFEEATTTIKHSLKKLYKGEVNVKVDLNEYTYYQIGDSGNKEVKSDKKLNLLEYFAKNGGFSGTSKINKISIYKKEENGYRLVDVNLKKMSIINQEEFYLDNGDIIVIDPVKTKNLGIGGGTGLSTIFTITSFITSMLAFYTIFKN